MAEEQSNTPQTVQEIQPQVVSTEPVGSWDGGQLGTTATAMENKGDVAGTLTTKEGKVGE